MPLFALFILSYIYVGDGHKLCARTCFEDCIHGKCSDGPDYKCICDLGWTGSDCSVDCGCHGHSQCELAGPGSCDQCQENTQGEFCQFCAQGSFGNATTEQGTEFYIYFFKDTILQ